jgi:hypothetical protein
VVRRKSVTVPPHKTPEDVCFTLQERHPKYLASVEKMFLALQYIINGRPTLKCHKAKAAGGKQRKRSVKLWSRSSEEYI